MTMTNRDDASPVRSMARAEGGRSLRELLDTYLTWITTPLLLLAFIALWKLYVVVLDISPFMLPPPEAVAA